MATQWTADRTLEQARNYQGACVLAAAAELEVFAALAPRPQTIRQLAKRLRADARGLTVLLDALTTMGLLAKRAQRYRVPKAVRRLLVSDSPQSVLPMVQHQANCLRRWSQLARTVKTGRPPRWTPSVRGAAGDTESFIGAMHAINVASADRVARQLHPLRYERLLDVGGASGTWTVAFLRASPRATAVLFDLPPVIALARRRLTAAGLLARVQLVAGDFHRDALPSGADLAWVSAIVHQNSRSQNRSLFGKIRWALVPGGHIAIRDIVMEPNHTAPVAGALFAVNMLVGTEGGGTYTFAELREDLKAAGFGKVKWLLRDAGMNSLVVARKR